MNAPCLKDDPFENYSKMLEITKKEQNDSIHSVSCLICILFATQIKYMITITKKMQKSWKQWQGDLKETT